MLKKRIIPILLLEDERLVKTRKFYESRDVGDPVKSAYVYNSQQSNELIILNINKGDRNINPLKKIIHQIIENCFMPVAIGGGINLLEDAQFLIENGSDKIILNSLTYKNYKLIEDIAKIYGSQSIIVCVDLKKTNDSYKLFSNCGQKQESIKFEDHIKNIQNSGAGEIMLQSINNDGIMKGYDMKIITNYKKYFKVPVIIAGGSGDYLHLEEALKSDHVDAVACGSIFNFTDSNPIRARTYLSNRGIKIKKI